MTKGSTARLAIEECMAGSMRIAHPYKHWSPSPMSTVENLLVFFTDTHYEAPLDNTTDGLELTMPSNGTLSRDSIINDLTPEEQCVRTHNRQDQSGRRGYADRYDPQLQLLLV